MMNLEQGGVPCFATTVERTILRMLSSVVTVEGGNEVQQMIGVNPCHQTTAKVNFGHLESKPVQIRWEVHTPDWNAIASCYTRRR